MTNLKIGEKHNRLTESEEIEILKLKNGKRSYAGDTALGLWGLSHSLTGGIAKSMWENQNIDWVFIRDRILTYFVNLFEWKGKDVTPDFKRELERILFRYGRVAIIKLPDGTFVPTQYTCKKEHLDFYGNPKKIQIVTTNKYSGKIYKKGDFVIVYNNTARYGTLSFANERMRQIVRALRDIDNASTLSRPKWGINTTDDDAAIAEAEHAMNSDQWLIPMGNLNFQDMDIQNLAGDDNTETKINTYAFQTSNLLKLLGLQVNDGNVKAERQTELEISRSDEYGGLLTKDMFDRRKEKVDELKEFGLDIDIEQSEELKEDTDKTDLKGEVNQAIERGAENDNKKE